MAVRQLASSPNLTRLYLKAAVTGLTGGDRLPDEKLVLRGIDVDREHLAAYDRVCSFRLRDRLPPTYPHVLAFPLAVELMSAPSFPFALPGLVHIANHIDHRRPLEVGEPLTVRVWTEGLRPHPKGRQFDVVSEVDARGETAWAETSTYLKRGRGSDDADAPGPSRGPERSEPRARWTVPGDTGRRYAAVSGDRNPIHLHPWTARPFGFPSNIAHGMWTKARCLAALEAELPDAYAVEVAFRKPLILPADVAFSAAHEEGAWRFALLGSDLERPHVHGRIT